MKYFYSHFSRVKPILLTFCVDYMVCHAFFFFSFFLSYFFLIHLSFFSLLSGPNRMRWRMTCHHQCPLILILIIPLTMLNIVDPPPSLLKIILGFNALTSCYVLNPPQMVRMLISYHCKDIILEYWVHGNPIPSWVSIAT